MQSLVEICRVILEKKILKFVNVSFLFCNNLLLEKGGALHLNKLESPSPKDAWCQVRLAHWCWRRRFKTFLSMYFRYFVISSSWKRTSPSFKQTWIPFTQGYFVPSLVEIGPAVLEKKFQMWKVTEEQRDDRCSEKLTWAFSSGELKRFCRFSFQ